MSNNQQWLQNGSLNLNREYFEEHIGHPVPDEVWEYMRDIPILTMDDWEGVYKQAQDYLNKPRQIMIEKYQDRILKIVEQLVYNIELEDVDEDYIYRWIISNMDYRLLDEGPEIISESWEELQDV